jgi:hypothetical protein
MRLWTIHPNYLDSKGLVALWREALLAQKVLLGATKGYRHHPQLLRFRATANPAGAIAVYLTAVHQEAVQRGYKFDATKIGSQRFPGTIDETEGQLRYEWVHLLRKLENRDHDRWIEFNAIQDPRPHPLFQIVVGSLRAWERIR